MCLRPPSIARAARSHHRTILAFFLIPFIGIRNLFLISLVPGSIAVVVLVYFVVEKSGLKKTTSIFKNAGKVLNRKFTTFLIVIGIFAIGAYNFSFVLVKANALGVDQATVPVVDGV